MSITWNIDEARRTILAQMDEAARLDVTIDGLVVRAEAAEADAFKMGARLAEWIDRAHNAEESLAYTTGQRDGARAEVARLRAALELAAKFVAKAHADSAYDNTAMSGERALRIIGEALDDGSSQ